MTSGRAYDGWLLMNYDLSSSKQRNRQFYANLFPATYYKRMEFQLKHYGSEPVMFA